MIYIIQAVIVSYHGTKKTWGSSLKGHSGIGLSFLR